MLSRGLYALLCHTLSHKAERYRRIIYGSRSSCILDNLDWD